MAEKIAALALLRAAAEAGYAFKVMYDGEEDFMGGSPAQAWEAVKATDQADVFFFKNGEKREWAYLMVPGEMTCDPDETVVDHTLGGFIEAWWEAHFKEAV